MALYIYTPQWFYGIDSIFEIVSVIVGLLIAFYAYKTYKYTSQKRYLYFASSFFMVAAAFFINIISNIIVYTRSLETRVIGLKTVNVYVLRQIKWVSDVGAFVSVFLFLLAFLILIVIMYNIKDKKINFLLFYLVLVAALYSKHSFIFFHGTLAVLLYMIFNIYYKNYKARKTKTRKLVAISFFIMVLSQVFFMISTFNGPMFVVAETTQLAGYLVLLFTIILVLKK